MFTGVIEQVGTVLRFEEYRGKRKLIIQTKWNDLQAGESIAINGIALTLQEPSNKGEAYFVVNEEAMSRSNFALLEANSRVNLERSLTLNSRLNGHWVQGQCDAKGMVLNCLEDPDGHRLTIALDPQYGRYCVERGFLSVNGVSLRIQSLTQTKLNEFMISFLVIPHVWKNTTLNEAKIGDFVHVEVDILTKYIEKLCPQGVAMQPLVNIAPMQAPTLLAQSEEATAESKEEIITETAASMAIDSANESSLEVKTESENHFSESDSSIQEPINH